MDRFRDQTYLLNNQYKDAAKFGARVDLHRRFSTNKYGFYLWVFDHFTLDERSTLLELGCGPGGLWQSNLRRIPSGWQITLTDFSPGMLQEARGRLGEERFVYEVADAQKLPFAESSFDAVIANHMLYHIPDLPAALGEIQRVLKPGGRLYATTFGRRHLVELDDLVAQLQTDDRRLCPFSSKSSAFILENGREQLYPYFDGITLDIYENALDVTEAEPLAAYAFSLRLGYGLTAEMRDSFRRLIRQELASRGVIHMTTAAGIFESHKAAVSHIQQASREAEEVHKPEEVHKAEVSHIQQASHMRHVEE